MMISPRRVWEQVWCVFLGHKWIETVVNNTRFRRCRRCNEREMSVFFPGRPLNNEAKSDT